MVFAATLQADRRCVMGNLRFAKIVIVDALVSSGAGSEVDLIDLGACIHHISMAVGVNKDDEELLRVWQNASANTPTYEEGSFAVSSVTVDDDGEVYVWGW